MLEELKAEVCKQNLRLKELNLVILTEGNVSAISPDRKLMVIKPSGVEYDVMVQEDMVVVDMEGSVVEGKYRPSTDTPTHLEIYKSVEGIGGIAHTHSLYATMAAQKQEPIVCYGTTHADLWGDIPVSRMLTDQEIESGYEKYTGTALCELMKEGAIPCALVPGHGPFTFGKTAKDAVNHAQILEKVATMAILGGRDKPLDKSLFDKHYNRKHGANRYYGQQ